jgi:hypothetical protein
LNYVLIFGLFGAPALGAKEQRLENTIARLVEMFRPAAADVWALKKSAAAKLREMDGFRSGVLWKIH